MNRLLLIVHVLLFLSIPSFSHEIDSIPSFSHKIDFHFAHLGNEEGLTDDRNNAFVYKDSEGFSWIGSQNGFYRFDGTFIKHYPAQLFGNYSKNVQSSFFEDNNTDLWFTTYDALHCYIRKADTLASIQFQLNNSALSNDYYAFHLDNTENTLWLNVDSFIITYNLRKKEIISTISKTSGKRFTVNTSLNGEITNIFAFPWRNKVGFEIWTRSAQGNWQNDYRNEGQLKDTRISQGIVQNDSIIWLISNKGLIKYDYLKKKLFKPYAPKEQKHHHFDSGVLFKFRYIILSSVSGDGLWLFDIDKKTYVKNWKSSKARGSLSGNLPKALHLDRDHQLWVMHLGNGMDYSLPQSSIFHNPLSSNKRTLKVKNILEDPAQNIWVMTKEKGIFIFDKNENLIDSFPKIDGHSDFSKAHLSMDSKGKCWLLLGNGVYNFNREKRNWKQIYLGTDKNNLISIYHGFKGHIIVVGTSGAKRLIEKVDHSTLDPIEIFNDFTKYEFDYFFIIDSSTALAPFKGDELWLIQKKKNEFSWIKKINLNSETYTALKSAKDSTIWIGGEKGLYRLIGEQATRVSLNPYNPDEHPSVFSIIEDSKACLWLSTDEGLWHFNPADQKLIKYTTQDGLSNNLFSQDAGLQASSGRIWFGNEKGLSVFSPDSIVLEPNPPSCYIENIWINNQQFNPEDNVNELDEITLNYFENTLAFELRKIGVAPSEKSSIRYRLKNYDNSWSITNNGGNARFTKIPPGEYQLEAMAIDEHNHKGTLKSLSVTISVPFWKELWFKVLCILFVLSLLLLMIRIYYQRKIRFQKRLLEKQNLIYQERNRIAKELHDDMGGGLSSILFISEDLSFETSDQSQKTQINRITSLSRNALLNMKDIIWALDTQQSTVQDLFNRLKIYASELFTDHKIILDLKTTINDENQRLLSSEKKRNILLVFKECLHNITKHSGASDVEILMDYSSALLSLQIKDNGKTFNPADFENKGYGINNIKLRMDVIEGNIGFQSLPHQGTVIKVTVPCN